MTLSYYYLFFEHLQKWFIFSNLPENESDPQLILSIIFQMYVVYACFSAHVT